MSLSRTWRAVRASAAVATWLSLAACDRPPPAPRQLPPAEIHALIQRASPGRRVDEAWSRDLRAAFTRLQLPATRQNVCAAIAVVAQESGFVADPEVPGLADITVKKLQDASANPAAWAAINIRLRQDAANGLSFHDNLKRIRTERDLERWYQEFMGAEYTGLLLKAVGKDVDTLISTLGSMQVSASFARRFARAHDWPADNIREQLYTREGGLLYGIAHLLAYEFHYADWAHLFADYNAGHYASRNAGFQRMVSTLSGVALTPDGDLLSYADGPRAQPSETSRMVVLALARHGRALSVQAVQDDLRQEKTPGFIDTPTYRAIAELHRQRVGYAITESMPRIRLVSDKIQRQLTTEWFARRVDQRYRRCLGAAR